ncbi:MAG: hypothetical protein WC233_02025 [Sphaerochaeta sp.]|nr:hypothetical protein [Spirochaetales bacterium]
MKRTLIVFTVILAVVSMSLVAHPTAEKQYAAIEEEILSLSEAKDAFKKLDLAIEREREALQMTLTEAQKSGNRQAFRQGRADLARLSTYRMSRAQSDALLSEIMALSEPSRSEEAAWLAQNSPYWRPRLILDFSAVGPGYRYSYRQQISQKSGSEVTLPTADQVRLNTRELGILAGWGESEDEVTYRPGEKIVMPSLDQTLYAIYESGVRFVDRKTGIDETVALDEVNITLPTAEDAVFAGWYDRASRTLVKEAGPYTPQGKGAFFEALWKELSIEDVSLLYVDQEKVPTGRQLGVGFSYANRGNVDLSGLEAILTTDSEHVRLLKQSIDLGRLSAGYAATNNSRFATRMIQRIGGERNTMRLVISPEAPSGTEITLTLTISDGNGDRWSRDLVLVVE